VGYIRAGRFIVNKESRQVMRSWSLTVGAERRGGVDENVKLRGCIINVDDIREGARERESRKLRNRDMAHMESS
jgi:hypothetical protein